MLDILRKCQMPQPSPADIIERICVLLLNEPMVSCSKGIDTRIGEAPDNVILQVRIYKKTLHIRLNLLRDLSGQQLPVPFTFVENILNLKSSVLYVNIGNQIANVIHVKPIIISDGQVTFTNSVLETMFQFINSFNNCIPNRRYT